jgi:hypothetical protein
MGFELIDRLIENATGDYTESIEEQLNESELEMSKAALKEWFSLMEEDEGMENEAHDSDEDGEEKDELEDDDEDKEAKTEALKEWFALIEEEMEAMSDSDTDSEDGEDDDDSELEDDEDDEEDEDENKDVKSIKVEIAKEELKEWFNLIEEEENKEDQMPKNNSHDEDWADDSDNEPVPDDGEAAESAADLIGKDATKEAIKEWYKTITNDILSEDSDE